MDTIETRKLPSMSEDVSAPAEVSAPGEDYRAVAGPAVIGVVAAVLTVAGFILPFMLTFGVAAVLFGLIGYSRVRRYPEEYTGASLGLGGAVAGVLLAVAGTSYHAYVYATEVPEGYQRINFRLLQPSDERPDLPIPPKALDLDGQRVFIKGYVYPGAQKVNLKNFVLVPDRGTCCFGGQPKLTDMIEVTLKEPLRTNWSFNTRRLGGILRVDREVKPISGLGGVYYRLEADYVK